MTASDTSGSAYAVVFVHGFLDAGAVWETVIAQLTDGRAHPVAPDLPGMGALSSHTGDLSLAAYADVVSAAIRTADLPVILVGHSMGAQVAELAALANPGAVKALVLVTPVPLGGVHAPAEMVSPFKRLGGDPAGQRQVRLNLSPALTADQLDRLGGFGADVAPGAVARLVDIWNEGDARGAAPSAFAGPVTILRGADDPFATQDMVTAVAARFSDAVLQTVAEAGHWLHVEQPACVAGAIEAVSDRLGAGDWRSAFAQRSGDAFAQTLAEDVQLEAGVMYAPVRGRETVKQVMEAASKIYESLEFVAQAQHQNTQYLQWTARAFGGVGIDGVTVITRNDANLIQTVAIHHRPLGAALMFSARIAERLGGVVPPSHFCTTADLPSRAGT